MSPLERYIHLARALKGEDCRASEAAREVVLEVMGQLLASMLPEERVLAERYLGVGS